MELLIASIANAAIDCLWMTVVLFGFGTARAAGPPAPAESPLVAESSRDLAAFIAGTLTHAEFTVRADARAAALKS